MRSKYLLPKNHIPHSTTYKELIELHVLNGDELLEKHLSEGPSNAQYTSGFSARVLIEAIDIWIERKLMRCLHEGPYFSIFQMSTRTPVLRKSYPSVADGQLMENQRSTS